MFTSGVHSSASAPLAEARDRASELLKISGERNFMAETCPHHSKRQAITESDLLFRGVFRNKEFAMQIHIARSGQQLGPFSIEEINRKLSDGTLSPTDQAWYEGASGWGPLSSVPGVTISGGPSSPPIPVSPPPPAPAPSASVARPVPGPGPNAVQPAQSYTGMAVASWMLIGLTALLSIVPVLGFGAWLLAFIVIPVVLILAIVILTRGGTGQGIFLLITSLMLLPAFIFVAPLASTLILGASVSEREKSQETQIMENLRKLSDAKAQWVAQTKAADGATVTMSSLTTYLGGKDVKPVVGETYNPMPVGQEPTAKLPATKSLASHEKGAVLTAGASTSVAETPSPTTRPSESDTSVDTTSPSPTPEEL